MSVSVSVLSTHSNCLLGSKQIPLILSKGGKAERIQAQYLKLHRENATRRPTGLSMGTASPPNPGTGRWGGFKNPGLGGEPEVTPRRRSTRANVSADKHMMSGDWRA